MANSIFTKLYKTVLVILFVSITAKAQNFTMNGSAAANISVCPGPISFASTSGTVTKWTITGPSTNFTSALQNPVFPAITPGDYTVVLQSAGGTSTKTYRVFPKPIVNFTTPAAIVCKGSCAALTNASTAGTPNGGSPIGTGGLHAYQWNITGPAGFTALTPTSESPTVCFTSTGLYTAFYRVTDANGCVDSLTKTNFISAVNSPTASFTPSTQYFCTPAGANVSFTNTSTPSTGLTYCWNFNAGSNCPGTNCSLTTKNPTNIPFTSTSLNSATTVCLTVTETSSGCKSNASVPITIYNPFANFTANQTVGCQPFPVDFQFTGSGAVSYTWDFGDGPPITGLGGTPSHLYTSPGTYTVSVTANNLGNAAISCPVTKTFTNFITVNPKPIATFVTPNASPGPNADTCFSKPGDTYSTTFFNTTPGVTNISWDFNYDGINFNGTSTGSTSNHIYNATGIYQVGMIATNSFGCKDTAEFNSVRINAPNIDFTAVDNYLPATTPVDGCTALGVTFSPTYTQTGQVPPSFPITKWEWNYGAGSGIPSAVFTPPQTTFSATYLPTGEFDVTLIITNSEGCTDTVKKPKFVRVGKHTINDFYADRLWDCYNRSGLRKINFVYVRLIPGSAPNFIAPPDTVDKWEWSFGSNYDICPTCTPTPTLPMNSKTEGTDIVGSTNYVPTWYNADNNSAGPGGFKHQYAYTDTGYFDVRLVTFMKGCRDTLEKDDYIYNRYAKVDFAVKPADAIICKEEDHNVEFTNKTHVLPDEYTTPWPTPVVTNDPTTYIWNFGDPFAVNTGVYTSFSSSYLVSSPTSTAIPPNGHTYTQPGYYTIELKAIRSYTAQPAPHCANCPATTLCPTCPNALIMMNDTTCRDSLKTTVPVSAERANFRRDSTGCEPFNIWHDFANNVSFAYPDDSDDDLNSVTTVGITGAPVTTASYRIVYPCGLTSGPLSISGALGNFPSLDKDTTIAGPFPPSNPFDNPIPIPTAALTNPLIASPLFPVFTATAPCNGATGSGYGPTPIKYIVTNSLGCVDSITKIIEPKRKPQAYITNSNLANGCIPYTVFFNDYNNGFEGPNAIAINVGDTTKAFANSNTIPVQQAYIDSVRIDFESDGYFVSQGDVTIIETPLTDSITYNSGMSHVYNTYTAPGTTATITVYDSYGCVNTDNVVVHPQKPIAFFSTTDVCNLTAASFDPSASQPPGTFKRYYWVFSDGTSNVSATTAINSGIVSYTFPNIAHDSIYDVTLVVEDEFGCVSLPVTKPIKVQQPVASFRPISVPPFCKQRTIYFHTETTNQNSWTYSIATNSAGPYVAEPLQSNIDDTYGIFFNNPGLYSIKLTVTDNLGCTDDSTQVDLLKIGGSSANIPLTISPTPADASCVPFNVNLTMTGAINVDSVLWLFGDGGSIGELITNGTGTLTSPTYSYMTAAVNPYQTSAFIYDIEAPTCPPDYIPGPFVSIHGPILGFTRADTAFCSEGTVTFTNTSIGGEPNGNPHWEWDFGDGSAIYTDKTPPPHLYNKPGTYDIKLYANTLDAFGGNCHFGPIIKKVYVFQGPTLSPTYSNAQGCVPLRTSFNVDVSGLLPKDTILSLTWNFADLDSITGLGAFNPPLNDTLTWGTDYSAPIHYYIKPDTTVTPILRAVFKTSFGSCPYTYSPFGNVTTYPDPIANFTAEPQIIENTANTVNFTDSSSTDVTTRYWTFGDGASSNEINPVYAYAADGKYTVLLKVNNSFGCEDTISKVFDIDMELIIPNIFTPNGDGQNETFNIKVPGFLKGLTLDVYDRWGKKLYHSDNYHNDWNGKDQKGKELFDDTYYYIINYNNKLTWNGWVMIKRS